MTYAVPGIAVDGLGELPLPKILRSTGAIAAIAACAVLIAGVVFGLPVVLVLLLLVAIFTIAAAQISRRYVTSRLISLIPVMLAVTFLTFIMLSLLPGDPAINVLGNSASPEAIEEFREKNKLDDPVLVRYFRWLGSAVKGDLGDSVFTNEAVSSGIARTLPISLQYMVYAQIFALALALPLGIYGAYRAGGRADRMMTTSSFGILAVPNFVLALLFIFFFALGGFEFAGGSRALGAKFLPATGHVGLGESVVDHFRHWVLPVLALGLGQAVVYLRLLRTDMIATLQEDFVYVAKAKGMSDKRILLMHALRPSSFTLLTVAGINIGALLAGSLILETIFTIPGIGTYLVGAILQRDWLVVQGVVVVLSVGFVFANFVVDVLYAVLDPRIRHARSVA